MQLHHPLERLQNQEADNGATRARSGTDPQSTPAFPTRHAAGHETKNPVLARLQRERAGLAEQLLTR